MHRFLPRSFSLPLLLILIGNAVGQEKYEAWQQRGEFWLLTTPEGANLPAGAACENFPVLVRLHRDFFDFAQAQPAGEDIRFAASSGEALSFQIEGWDAKAGEASVWVRVPKITGNARQMIRMFWGNGKAKSASDGTAVFNSSNGYLAAWHMSDSADSVGTLTSNDTGTSATTGMIGPARHFPGGKGIFAGDKIETLPAGSDSHSTEAWFRAEKPNTTIVAWGNEQAQGKVVMQYRSPPHVRMDCYFSGGNVNGTSQLTTGEWNHVVHTYEKGEARLYVNGQPEATNKNQGPPLNIRRPARLFIGGWYNNYDFAGEIDEVRVSNVVRSADWIKLQFENQKPLQTLVGPLVQSGGPSLAVTANEREIAEGKTVEVSVKASGAQKIYWYLERDGKKSLVATDRFSYSVAAGRVTGDKSAELTVKAIYPDVILEKSTLFTIREAIAEPQFTLDVTATWDGRQPLVISPRFSNVDAVKQAGVPLDFTWSTDDVAVIKQASDKLLLKRAQGDGVLRIKLAIHNGGAPAVKTAEIRVTQPKEKDQWLPQPRDEFEQPVDGQFIAREGSSSEGTIHYAGELVEAADQVFVRVYVDDKLISTDAAKTLKGKKYRIAAKLKAGLVKYRVEFGVNGEEEKVLHAAKDIVCGDAFIIIGQSNAVATDFGKENPLQPSEWVRTFGATDGGPQGSRLKQWASAEARAPGGKAEIGYWGMELGRRLVESQKIPICFINGAVGGTRIDQHQRNNDDPTDVKTIYGRLLWRVREAKLTHGVRGIIWHQGENDQGADGPTGGYGYETYRQYFVDMAGSWKEDYPNVQHYFMFQIWPKSCAMGINGSDNRLREVQRTMPRLFSNLSIMSTCGVKPPGGCHFPAAGYAEFARLIQPQIERHIYGKAADKPIDPPSLQRAYFTSDKKDELALEFDQPIVWQDSLVNQFHLIGEPKQVESGAVSGNILQLKLKAPSKATQVTYLDSAAWSPDNVLMGANGIAALTFCEVLIER